MRQKQVLSVLSLQEIDRGEGYLFKILCTSRFLDVFACWFITTKKSEDKCKN